MGQKLFFCRHANSENGALSNPGMRDAELLREVLGEMDFAARFAFSSTAERCVQTAQILAPKIPVRKESVLHEYGNGSFLMWRADTFLAPIEAACLPEAAHAVVVTHDCMSVAMAWRWIEHHGGKADWDSPELAFLAEASGFLVEETRCFKLTPNGSREIIF